MEERQARADNEKIQSGVIYQVGFAKKKDIISYRKHGIKKICPLYDKRPALSSPCFPSGTAVR